MKKIDVNFLEPSHQQLNNLIEYYQARRYDDAEKLSLSITQEFPKYQFAWKVLAAVLKQNGKINKSLVASQKSVELGPLDVEAHNNLGITLKDLGRLEEAEASYRQAIKLKPDYAEAHYNLSNNLSYMNDLEKEINALKSLLKLDVDKFGFKAGVNLAICNFLEGDFVESKKQVLAAKKIQKKTLYQFKTEKIYQRYLLKILEWH